METAELKSRLSANLKKLRKEKGWTQFELAERADISEQTVNSIESRRLWPSEKTLVKITNALGADVHRFFMPESDRGIPAEEISFDLRLAVVQSVRNLVEKTLLEYSPIANAGKYK